MKKKRTRYCVALLIFKPLIASEQAHIHIKIRIRNDIKADNIVFKVPEKNVLPRLVIKHKTHKPIAYTSQQQHHADINAKTLSFDNYIQQKMNNVTRSNGREKPINVTTWEQLCQCIKINRESDRLFYCPYSSCTSSDFKRVDYMASCYVRHSDDRFFSCPHCNYVCEKYSLLKIHYIYECKNYSL